jgi:hypothetical protein
MVNDLSIVEKTLAFTMLVADSSIRTIVWMTRIRRDTLMRLGSHMSVC